MRSLWICDTNEKLECNEVVGKEKCPAAGERKMESKNVDEKREKKKFRAKKYSGGQGDGGIKMWYIYE